jgi:hypothetical protein
VNKLAGVITFFRNLSIRHEFSMARKLLGRTSPPQTSKSDIDPAPSSSEGNLDLQYRQFRRKLPDD